MEVHSIQLCYLVRETDLLKSSSASGSRLASVNRSHGSGFQWTAAYWASLSHNVLAFMTFMIKTFVQQIASARANIPGRRKARSEKALDSRDVASCCMLPH